MYEAYFNNHKIDGKRIPTWTRDIYDLNALEVEAGTNGYTGNDNEKENLTYFRIQDVGGTDMKVSALEENGHKGVEVVFAGDGELTTAIRALKFIVKVLEDQVNHVDD